MNLRSASCSPSGAAARRPLRFLLLTAALLALAGTLHAQLPPDTARPLRPSYGWPIGDFLVGVGTAASRHGSRTA